MSDDFDYDEVRLIGKASTYAGWIEALAIFAKFDDSECPLHAEHDVIYAGPNPDTVSHVDRVRLAELGWWAHDEFECFGRYT